MEKSRTRTLVYCEVSKISSGIYENKKSGILTQLSGFLFGGPLGTKFELF